MKVIATCYVCLPKDTTQGLMPPVPNAISTKPKNDNPSFKPKAKMIIQTIFC